MKPTHKITIEGLSFKAYPVNHSSYSLINADNTTFVLTGDALTALNAKIEEIVPFRFEADVEWDTHHGLVSLRWPRDRDLYPYRCLVGKKGRLVFTEDTE
jgi:hypothetical protein